MAFGKKKSTVEESSSENESAEAASAAESPPPEVEAAPAPKSKAAAKAPAMYRVMKEQHVSLNGCLTTLREGQLIDPVGYPPSVIASIKQQGTQLEEV